jgi:hypothetical protein
MDAAMEIPETPETVPEAATPADLLSSVELIEAEAAKYALLSPKSRSALDNLRSGSPLSESDRNALKHLIERLRHFRVSQSGTNPISDALATPKATEPAAKKRWSLWKKT